ncbi:MAG: hypothetical protein ACPGU0_03730, partial [Marinirhabdus sp.]
GGTGNDPQGTNLSGSIFEDTVLDPSLQYRLSGAVVVKAGAKLTIPAGTVIVSEAAQDRYLAVERGAQIYVQGTAVAPVVMRSENGNAGDWGGLVILGDAPTTAGTDVTAEVGGFVYGGTNAADNSGSIDYLIVRHAGQEINTDSQYNGLSLYAVGSGTTINNIAILNGSDDGVEFFGGTVSATNLYFENNEDDSVDWTEGWNGTLTNTYVLHANNNFSTAIEADGENLNPKVVNFTAVSTSGGTALQFKKQSGATITGLSLTGYGTSIDYKDNGAPANVTINGEVSDPLESYTAPATVAVSMFDWVK